MTEKELKFIWKVENYSYCWSKVGEYLKSPDFELKVFEGSSWCLKLSPRGLLPHEECISVYLQRLGSNGGPFPITVDYEIALIRSDGTAEYAKNTKNRIFRKGEVDGPIELASREEILGSKKSILLPDGILTVRCRILPKGAQLKSHTDIIAKTHLELERFVFRWDNKRCLFDRYTERYTLLLLNGRENVSFRLRRNEFNQIEYLCLSFETKANIKSFRVRICILDCSFSISRCLLDDHYFNVREMNVNLIPVDEILEHSYLYLLDDKLTLHCDLTFSFGTFHSQIEQVTYDDIFPDASATTEASEMDIPQISQVCSCTSFKNDFQNLYQEGTLCDFTLKVGSEKIKVHKAVLGARSPVFKAMLTSNMVEIVESMVDISDLDADTVRRMLTFMYTDATGDLDFQSASKLYFAADKYDITKLKSICSIVLEQNLCVSNVGEALLISNMHGDDYLKNLILEFIFNHETEVMSSQQWQAFKNVHHHFVAETICYIFMRKAEKVRGNNQLFP